MRVEIHGLSRDYQIIYRKFRDSRLLIIPIVDIDTTTSTSVDSHVPPRYILYSGVALTQPRSPLRCTGKSGRTGSEDEVTRIVFSANVRDLILSYLRPRFGVSSAAVFASPTHETKRCTFNVGVHSGLHHRSPQQSDITSPLDCSDVVS